jgi:GGDEF domain-containing protein
VGTCGTRRLAAVGGEAPEAEDIGVSGMLAAEDVHEAAILFAVARTGHAARVVASHNLSVAQLAAVEAVPCTTSLVLEVARAGEPQFGHLASGALSARVEAWLVSVSAASYALLPLVSEAPYGAVVLVLSTDPDPLSAQTQRCLAAVTGVFRWAAPSSHEAESVPGGRAGMGHDEPVPAPAIDPSVAPGGPAAARQPGALARLDRRATVGDLAQTDTLLSGSTLTSDVVERFEREPKRHCFVIGEDGVPLGLITREKLHVRLSHLYGNALFRKKPVTHIMDVQPLIVNGAVPPGDAAQRATARPFEMRYDPLVVTVGGQYLGTVAVFALLDHLNGEAVRRARLSNALSGLPGAVLLQQEVADRLGAMHRLAFVVIDLDFFKPYNDHYGLARGDGVLLAMAQLGQAVVQELGGTDDVFGHIGGDDFIILTTPDRATSLCAAVVKRFDALAPGLYDRRDLENRGIVAEDREGSRRFFPLISATAVAVSAAELAHPSYETLTAEASRRKVAVKLAKDRDGSADKLTGTLPCKETEPLLGKRP